MGIEDFLPFANKGYNNLDELQKQEEEKKEEDYKRGIIDRVLGVIQNTSATNALYNMTDGDKDTGILEGIGRGVQQMNPFEDNVTDRHTTSDVLGNLGWNPESTVGKLGKGVVGFAGDVLLDPLTYLSGGFSAIPKILKGTVTAVHTAEGIKNISGLTIEQATEAMDKVYKARNIDPATMDDAIRLKDIENLQKSVNEKLFKISKDGADVTYGLGNMPFSSKIATGEDKTLASFKKTLLTNDQLRNFGDKTIAPYWNELSQKIGNIEFAKKFQKNEDLVELAKTNPVEASMKYKIYKMNDKVDSELFAKDMDTFKKTNHVSEMWNGFTPEEQSEFVSWYENGGYKDTLNSKKNVEEFKKKVTKRYGVEFKGKSTNIEEFQSMMDEMYNGFKKDRIDNQINFDDVKGKILSGDYDESISKIINGATIKTELKRTEPDIIDGLIDSGDLDDVLENVLKNQPEFKQEQIEKIKKSSTRKALDYEYNGDGLDESKIFEDKLYEDGHIDPEIIKSMYDDFKTGGKYKDEVNKQYLYSLGMNPNDAGTLKLNAGKVNEDVGRMEDVIVGLDNMFGKKFKLTTLPDGALDNLLSVINSKDRTALTEYLDDLYVSKQGKGLKDSKIWDRGLLKAQATTGLNISNTKPYYTGADGNKVEVALTDIPKKVKEYNLYKELIRNPEVLDNMKTECDGLIGEQRMLNNFIEKNGVGNAEDINSPLSTSYTYNERYNNVTNKVNVLKSKIDIYENILNGDTKYTVPMLKNFSKQTGMSLEELATLAPERLEQFTNSQNQHVMNIYNKFNGQQKGYDFGEYNKGANEADDYLRSRDETNLYEDTKELKKEDVDIYETQHGYANEVQNDYQYSNTQRNTQLFGKGGTSARFGADDYDKEMIKFYAQQQLKKIPETSQGLEMRKKLIEKGYISDMDKATFKNLDELERNNLINDFQKYQENSLVSYLSKMNDNDVINKAIMESNDPATARWYANYLYRRTGQIPEQLSNIAMKTEDATKPVNSLGSFETPKIEELEPETVERISKLTKNNYSYDVSRINKIVKDTKPDKYYDLAKYISEEFRKVGYEEMQAGRLTKEQFERKSDEYLTHLLTDDAKKYLLKNFAEDFKYGFNPMASAQGYKKHFDQTRKYNTIEEANKTMQEKFKDAEFDKWFEDDITKIFEARCLASNELLYSDSVTNAIKVLCGNEYKAVEKMKGYTPVIPFVDLNKFLLARYDGEIPDKIFDHLGLEKEMFSPNNAYIEVNDDMINKINALAKQDGRMKTIPQAFNLDTKTMERMNVNSLKQRQLHQSEFLKLYDKFLMMWKQWNSSINPGFHIQNSVSGAFQNFLSDGITMFDPRRYKEAFNIVTDKTPDKMININGQEITYRQLKELAERSGALSKSFFKSDMNITDEGMLGDKINPKLDPTNNGQFVPYKVGAKVGSTVENTQRLALLIKHLEDGDSLESAIDSVNKFLFDYSDVTQFEQDVVKRVIPFYTFMRKNVPMELEAMLNVPQRFVLPDKAFNNFEKMNGDNYQTQNDRPPSKANFVQLPFQVEGKNIGIDVQLPYEQLSRLTPRKLAGTITPMIKAPIELATGKYVSTDKTIISPLDYLLGQTTPTRILNNSKIHYGDEKGTWLLGQLLGLPIEEIN